ncbi:superoxide dismutase [Candidatus Roizmanbacteria bacterium]|nr:superoxide dismutase [Candidatus Roizmanbacteria bacterium]
MFTKITAQTFSDALFSMKGISKKTVEEHLKLYQGYVNKYNEINEKLGLLTDDDYTKANQVFSTLRELKVELSFAWGGVVNHEIYFAHLGGKGGLPTGDLLKQIEKDFGSYDGYKKDLKASGIAARGWVWTGWNMREKRLFNYVGDSQNTYLAWEIKPILALDTYEHAYFIDYGVNRGSYIDAFLENVNWDAVGANFKK